ncbi:hypothetical protein [Streptomyces luteireticuli]|uniref:hypothetical protein n=1 Tax=Streptomyces luteireticuli TaxID=173858 RepID=UPI0035575786
MIEIESALQDAQTRTPAYTGEQRAEDDHKLFARIHQVEERRARAVRDISGWLAPTSPELAALVLESVEGPTPAAPRKLKQRLRRDLKGLCRQIIKAPGAAPRLFRFVGAECPTDPVGARGLGCLLYLSGAGEEGARFWWRYAAGADDATAAYLLFLDNLLRGQPTEAVHCYRQLNAGAFLCDEDWETPANRPSPAADPLPVEVGSHIREVTAGPANASISIPEGYLDNVSQEELDDLVCHR